ncbi:MAG TPA: 3-dehydroquinate synthase, partial [Polyangiaceae bacterium]|nr:3-dehydroquinate synthase [Polyangiaceae bacterium]
IVKIALTSDAALLARLEAEARAIARGDHAALLPVVRAAIAAKIRVVRDDEREAGARALLNLGHTVGHALEAHGGYARWLHGEAVSIGLVVEMRAMVSLGWTPPALAERTCALLRALGLPVDAQASELAAAWHYVGADKKRAKDSVRFAVVSAAGAGRVERVRLADLKGAVLGV